MENKTKATIAGAVAAAAIGGAFLIVPSDKHAAPGYELVHEANGTYTVYDVHDGKRSKFGENLTAEQADHFTDNKK